MTLYKIRDWDKHYENNKSRERERCSFCCVPNKQDGLGYGLLLSEPDGESLYGAFVAVVLIASKQKVRQGYLTAHGLPAECPLTARQLSVKCRFKETTIQRMLDVCSSEVGWIEELESKCPPSAHEVPAECPPSALEGKGREGNRKKGREEPTNHPDLEACKKHYKGNGSGYSPAEVEHVFNSFEATAIDGHWLFGKHRVSDWRTAMATRLYDNRKRDEKPSNGRSAKDPNIL